MTLSPTNVMIDGCRVWLQDATNVTVEHVNYRAQWGVHVETKTNMPKAERIEVDGTTPGKQKQVESGTTSGQPAGK